MDNLNSKDETITSAQDKNIKASVRFDSEYEFFTWKGDFEEFKFQLKSWIDNDYVEFLKENYTLGIKQYKEEKVLVQKYYLYRLPYQVILNTKYINRSDLKWAFEEYDLIEHELKLFFEEGKAIEYDLFTPKTKQTFEIMIFGYFTYKRFIDYLEKHFPEYLKKVREFGGKPVSEILDVFKSANLSIEELEIELKKAISNEQYERASFLRDKIKSLKS